MKNGTKLEKYEVNFTKEQMLNKAWQDEQAQKLKDRMQTLSVEHGCAVVASVVFGSVSMIGYRVPSAIPFDAVGFAKFGGCFFKGEFKQFSTAKKIQYQNSGMVSDR